MCVCVCVRVQMRQCVQTEFSMMLLQYPSFPSECLRRPFSPAVINNYGRGLMGCLAVDLEQGPKSTFLFLVFGTSNSSLLSFGTFGLVMHIGFLLSKE